MSSSDGPTTSAPPPRKRRRGRTFLLGGLAVLVIAGAVGAWQLNGFVERTTHEQLAVLGAKMGRDITLGHLGVHLLPRPAVSVTKLVIGPEKANPQDGIPAVELAEARVSVAWSTVFSLGQRPRVQAVVVDGLTVNVVRYKDGTLNLQHIADALSEPKPASPPPTSSPPAAARAAVVDELRFTHGTFRFFDRSGQAPEVAIREVTLSGDHLGAAQRFTLALAAAIGASAPNFHLTLQAAPAPEGSVVSTLEELTLSLTPIDLAPFAPYLAAGAPALAELESARAEAQLTVHAGSFAPGGTGPLTVKGGFGLREVTMHGGRPFELSLALDVSGDNPGSDLRDAQLDAREIALRLGTPQAPMTLTARGTVAHVGSVPRFTGLDVHSQGFDFDQLRALWPGAFARAGVELAGPFGLDAKGNGTPERQTLSAWLDLGAATLGIPRQFRKPAGVPLRVEVAATTSATTVDIARAAVTLADWQLEAHGQLAELGSPNPRVDLVAVARAPGVGGLLRLLPPVAAALPPQAKIGGSFTVDASAKGTARALTGQARVVLAGLDVKVPDARLGGGGKLEAAVETKGSALHAEAHADFAGLEAVYTDLLRKTAGTPLGFDVVVDGQTSGSGGAPQDLALKLDVRAASLVAHGTVARRRDAFDAKLDVPPFRVRSLGAMLPTVRELGVGDIQIGAAVKATGNVKDPEALRVTLDPLTVKGARTDVRGKALFSKPSQPHVEAELSGPMLDLDEVMPPSGKPSGASRAAEKPGRNAAPASGAPSPLATVEGRARLDVKRVRAMDIDLSNLEGDFTLSHGLAIARTLRVGVFGGTFEGSGTEVDLAAPSDSGHVKAKGALKDIDVGAALGRFAGSTDLLQGRLSADIDLTGGGTTPEILARTLDGTLRGRLDKAVFPAASLAGNLAAPLAQKISSLGAANKIDPQAWAQRLSDKALGDLDLGLAVSDGAMAFTKPLEAKTAYGPATLSGRVLLRGAFDLKGSVALSAESVNALLGDRIALTQPLPIALSITGPLRAPHVTPANLDTVVRVLAEGLARAAARRAATGAAKDVAAAALSDTRAGEAKAALEAKARAAEADRAAAETKLREQAEGARLQAEKAQADAKAQADEALRRQTELAAQKAAEAKAQADEAKKQAQDRARDKLRGILGK